MLTTFIRKSYRIENLLNKLKFIFKLHEMETESHNGAGQR